jgi:uncharacterized OB-fold protein
MTTIETEAPVALTGTRCAACDRNFWPARDLCPTCWASDLPAHDLPLTGTVATWTVVRMGKLFEVPYALCYADFEGDVRVLGRVVNWTEDRPLAPGMTVTTHTDAETGDHVFAVDHASAPTDQEA